LVLLWEKKDPKKACFVRGGGRHRKGERGPANDSGGGVREMIISSGCESFARKEKGHKAQGLTRKRKSDAVSRQSSHSGERVNRGRGGGYSERGKKPTVFKGMPKAWATKKSVLKGRLKEKRKERSSAWRKNTQGKGEGLSGHSGWKRGLVFGREGGAPYAKKVLRNEGFLPLNLQEDKKRNKVGRRPESSIKESEKASSTCTGGELSKKKKNSLILRGGRGKPVLVRVYPKAKPPVSNRVKKG